MAQLKKVTVRHASFWYTKDDRNAIAVRGDEIEVGSEDYERGMRFEAFGDLDSEAIANPATGESEESEEPTTIPEILAEVGDDKEKAARFLDEEKAKGDDARSTLVEKLEAIANPES